VRAGLLLLCVAGGCATAPIRRDYPPPTTEDLVAALQQRAARIRSLRGEARVESRGRSATVLLAAERPGRLRFDVLSPFGSPLASLATDGKSVGYFDRGAGRFVRGPARACTLAWTVRLPLSPDDAVEVLLGSVPLMPAASSDVSWDERAGLEVLRVRAPDGAVEEIRLGGPAGAWTVRAAQLRDRAGRPRWRVEHDEWRVLGGFPMPRRTRVSDGENDVRLRYRDEEVNVPLPPGIFGTGAPPGVPVQEADCE
jgi:outer membrane lipoprotein-sorting protein